MLPTCRESKSGHYPIRYRDDQRRIGFPVFHTHCRDSTRDRVAKSSSSAEAGVFYISDTLMIFTVSYIITVYYY